MGRTKNAEIARQTLGIIENGFYTNPSGKKIPLKEEIDNARQKSILYRPDMFNRVFSIRNSIVSESVTTIFEVVNESTLSATQRMITEGFEKVLALNFASAKNPGGGFINGASAQEESLARGSALYHCLLGFPAMYEANRHFESCLYTDHMIYSPQVPVFRDGNDNLLEKPYLLSFITAPAVNTGAVMDKNIRSEIDRIENVMLARTEKVLSVAKIQGYKMLILGAWGCGVFRNDPEKVAEFFRQQLLENPNFKGFFEKIVFAVLDSSSNRKTIQAFQEKFPTRIP
jgi:uncharacterized protein (TIGR02452 family)